jgi:hypothetical protein
LYFGIKNQYSNLLTCEIFIGLLQNWDSFDEFFVDNLEFFRNFEFVEHPQGQTGIKRPLRDSIQKFLKNLGRLG